MNNRSLLNIVDNNKNSPVSEVNLSIIGIRLLTNLGDYCLFRQFIRREM